jgi:hypothetical protein
MPKRVRKECVARRLVARSFQSDADDIRHYVSVDRDPWVVKPIDKNIHQFVKLLVVQLTEKRHLSCPQ